MPEGTMKDRFSLGYLLFARRWAAKVDREELADTLNVSTQTIYDWESNQRVPLGTHRELLFELFPNLDRPFPNATHEEMRQRLYTLTGSLNHVELQTVADFIRVHFLAKTTGR